MSLNEWECTETVKCSSIVAFMCMGAEWTGIMENPVHHVSRHRCHRLRNGVIDRAELYMADALAVKSCKKLLAVDL